MKLYYARTAIAFSRKARILPGAINVQVDLTDVGNVADSSSEVFGPYLMMKVRMLVDGAS